VIAVNTKEKLNPESYRIDIYSNSNKAPIPYNTLPITIQYPNIGKENNLLSSGLVINPQKAEKNTHLLINAIKPLIISPKIAVVISNPCYT
jgi:hypothetical protein